jgi:hypothetical protein
MKVYVAQIDIPYEAPYQLGIFSSLEKAKERVLTSVKEVMPSEDFDYCVCEVEVDDISQESDYEAVWCLE